MWLSSAIMESIINIEWKILLALRPIENGPIENIKFSNKPIKRCTLAKDSEPSRLLCVDAEGEWNVRIGDCVEWWNHCPINNIEEYCPTPQCDRENKRAKLSFSWGVYWQSSLNTACCPGIDKFVRIEGCANLIFLRAHESITVCLHAITYQSLWFNINNNNHKLFVYFVSCIMKFDSKHTHI